MASFAPRAVRVIELSAAGAPVHSGLIVVEQGTRVVFNVRPGSKIDLVSAAAGAGSVRSGALASDVSSGAGS
jgi:hypothetical protein